MKGPRPNLPAARRISAPDWFSLLAVGIVVEDDELGLLEQEPAVGFQRPPGRITRRGHLSDPGSDPGPSAPAAGRGIIPAVPPSGVLAGQPEDQGPDVPAGRRAGLAAHGPDGPAVADDVAVPAQDRVRGGRQPQPLAPRFRYQAGQGRGQGPARPVQVRAARLPPLCSG